MRSKSEITMYIQRLEAEGRARGAAFGYAADRSMPHGFGLTKFDCGLILCALGQFLGFKVYGKADWGGRVLPGQIDPRVDGGEISVPYLGREGARADYAWLDARGACVAIFETDGRDNRPSSHLPETSPSLIREHRSTNNLFKLSHSVLGALGHVPLLRVWILFQVDNDYSVKNDWVRTPAQWRRNFKNCDELRGALVIADTELFAGVFLDYLCRDPDGDRDPAPTENRDATPPPAETVRARPRPVPAPHAPWMAPAVGQMVHVWRAYGTTNTAVHRKQPGIYATSETNRDSADAVRPEEDLVVRKRDGSYFFCERREGRVIRVHSNHLNPDAAYNRR